MLAHLVLQKAGGTDTERDVGVERGLVLQETADHLTANDLLVNGVGHHVLVVEPHRALVPKAPPPSGHVSGRMVSV